MRLDAVLVIAALAVPAAARAAPAEPAATAAASARADRGVRFELPAGYLVKETVEQEPGEENDLVYVATRGQVEIRVEVEKGEFACTPQAQAGAPRKGTLSGRATCEVEVDAPPSLDPAVGRRRAASLLVQFAGRHLIVVVFAPAQAEATRLARQVAASAAEEKR
jgi:hypothetical protein